MKPALFGLLVFAITTGLVFGGYALGYNDAKRDVAEQWWSYCRDESARFCDEEMPRQLGLQNVWGFR